MASAAAMSSIPAESSPEWRTPEARPPAASPAKSATPTAPPACRAAFSTADAVPARARSALARMQVVIAGTARPIPRGMSRKAGSISGYRLRSPSAQSRENPAAPTSAPQTTGTREPIRPVIHPLARLETVKLAPAEAFSSFSRAIGRLDGQRANVRPRR
jgi:hypothetical protein